MIYITKDDKIKQLYEIDRVLYNDDIKSVVDKNDIIIYSEDDVLSVIEKYFDGNEYKKLTFLDNIDKVIYYFHTYINGVFKDVFFLMRKKNKEEK